MESLLGSMSAIGLIIGLGYILLTIYMIVYFFRMSNDVRELKETLNIIKKYIVNQNYSENDEKISEVSSTVITDNKKFEISDENLNKLEELIRNQKKGLYNSINKNDYLDLLKGMINSKEDGQLIIERYSQLFNKEIITDLKKLTNNYNGIKNNLSSFIEYKVVTSEFPHDLTK